MFRPRRRRLKGLNVNILIPNLLTLIATCFGLSAIRWALQDKWEHALLGILAAAVLDALDGRIARLLKGTSKFGAELDSLSDFVCFGVAPAMMLYLWVMQDAGRFGWMVTLLYVLACGLRLARFNVMDEEPEMPAWAKGFFSGVPSPAAAGLVLLPLLLWVQTDSDTFRTAWLVAPLTIAVAGLMVSILPTYSFKNVKVDHDHVLPLMLVAAVTMAGLIAAPWATLCVILALYLGSIPLGVRTYTRLRQEAESHQAASEPDGPAT